MRFILATAIILLSIASLKAQIGGTYSKGAHILALGDNGVSISGVDAIFSNQAGILAVDNLAVIAASERRFELSDIFVGSFGVIKKVDGLGHLGISFATVRVESFDEYKLGLSYGRRLSERFDIAATVDYISAQIDQFGSKGLFTFELGLMGKINEELSLGFHIFSPAQVSINETNRLQTSFSGGMQYTPSEKVSLHLEFSKSIDYDPRIHAGVDYQFNKYISLQVGAATAPATFGFGVGFNLSNFRIFGAASRHAELGVSPAVSIEYEQ